MVVMLNSERCPSGGGGQLVSRGFGMTPSTSQVPAFFAASPHRSLGSYPNISLRRFFAKTVRVAGDFWDERVVGPIAEAGLLETGYKHSCRREISEAVQSGRGWVQGTLLYARYCGGGSRRRIPFSRHREPLIEG